MKIKWRHISRILAWLAGGLLVLFAAAIFALDWIFSQPCGIPETPAPVPRTAVWTGGCDGGYWIDLVDREGDRYRFKIYNAWSGDLLMDAHFALQGCGAKFPLASNWREEVYWYQEGDAEEDTAVYIRLKSSACTLKSEGTPLGGTDWPIIKEKYESCQAIKRKQGLQDSLAKRH